MPVTGVWTLPYTATLPFNYMTKNIQSQRVSNWFNHEDKTREDMTHYIVTWTFIVVYFSFLIISLS